MTLRQFLEKLGIHADECTQNKILEYELMMEYESLTPYPYDDGISIYKQETQDVELDHRTKTIILNNLGDEQ